MAFFRGCPVGWGGDIPIGAGLVKGGVDQGPIKRRQWHFFRGCLVGWGGIPIGAGLVEGGVEQGPWLRQASFQEGRGMPAGWWTGGVNQGP